MLEHHSLKVLRDISKHPTLGGRVQTVIISTHYWPQSPIRDSAFSDAGLITRKLLLRSGLAKELLTTAFANLPNLQTVGIRDYFASKSSGTGANLPNKSYGWSFIIGNHIHTEGDGGRADSCPIFPFLIYCLGSAGACPDKFNVELQGETRLSIRDFAVLSPDLGDIVRPTLQGLVSVKLSLQHAWGNYNLCPHRQWAEVTAFLRETVSLRQLSLDFNKHGLAFDRLLVALVDERKVPEPSPFLPHLEGLKFSNLTVDATTLVQTLVAFDLTRFTLEHVSLENDEDPMLHKDRFPSFVNALADQWPEESRIQRATISSLAVYDGHGRAVSNGEYNMIHTYPIRFGRPTVDNTESARVPLTKVEFPDPAQEQSVEKDFPEWLRGLVNRSQTRGFCLKHLRVDASPVRDETEEDVMNSIVSDDSDDPYGYGYSDDEMSDSSEARLAL